MRIEHEVPMEVPGYEQRIKNEIRHYTSLMDEQSPTDEVTGVLPRVPVFEYGMNLYQPYLSLRMKHLDLESYVVDRQRLLGRPLRLLSLGCGTGDWEMRVAVRSRGAISIHLIDLSMDLLRKSDEVGAREGVSVEATAQDVNQVDLPRDTYDFVLCRSSLHHFFELEHVFNQIRKTLSKRGQFVVVGEWIGSNGLQAYPETAAAAQKLFAKLPERLRLNRYTNVVDATVPNIDHSVDSFEAIRSEHIMPLLLKSFTPYEYVTFDAFMSLLLDFRYGPNYDLTTSDDLAIAESLIRSDIAAIQSGMLRPTAMFGIFQ